jgi:hypothetical protein
MAVALRNPARSLARSPLAFFAGHSGFIAALAGIAHDIQAAAAGAPAVPAVPERRVADDMGLSGGLVEVFVPPLARGAGAVRSGAPLSVRGIPGVG